MVNLQMEFLNRISVRSIWGASSSNPSRGAAKLDWTRKRRVLVVPEANMGRPWNGSSIAIDSAFRKAGIFQFSCRAALQRNPLVDSVKLPRVMGLQQARISFRHRGKRLPTRACCGLSDESAPANRSDVYELLLMAVNTLLEEKHLKQLRGRRLEKSQEFASEYKSSHRPRTYDASIGDSTAGTTAPKTRSIASRTKAWTQSSRQKAEGIRGHHAKDNGNECITTISTESQISPDWMGHERIADDSDSLSTTRRLRVLNVPFVRPQRIARRRSQILDEFQEDRGMTLS